MPDIQTNQSNQKIQRSSGYDLLRVMAMYMVLSLHFFLYSGFYNQPMTETPIIIGGALRMLCYQCVPLFLMLSGALKRKAVFSAKHYIKIMPIIVNSWVVGLIVVAYKMIFNHEHWPLFTWLKSLWMFSQPGYGWYVNLYISLYLMMPIFNGGYQMLKSRKQKLAAVCVIAFTTTMAISVNRFTLHLSIGDTNLGFMPNSYAGLWSLAYYAAGMYIDEFKPKVNKIWCGLAVILLLLGEAVLNSVTTTDGWNQGITFNNEDIVNVIISSLIFLLIYDIDIKNQIIRKILSWISPLSMTVYLISWIGDSIYSRKLGAEGVNGFVLTYLKIIPLHFLGCVLISFPINWLVGKISRSLMNPLFRLADKPKNETLPE